MTLVTLLGAGPLYVTVERVAENSDDSSRKDGSNGGA
jgi:hypothetical protein